MGRILRIALIVAAIYFIVMFSLVWLGIIAAVTFSMPFLTNFFPGQELMTVVSMMNVLFVIGIPLLAIILGITRVVFRRRIGKGWTIGLGLFWLVNVVSLVGLGSTLAQEFLVEDQVEELTDATKFAADTVRLSFLSVNGTNGARFSIGGEKVSLPGASVFTKIRKSPDADWHLMQRKASRARNGIDARELARELKVSLIASPGELAIPSEVPFSELRKWRAQEAQLELNIPVGGYVYLDHDRLNASADLPIDKRPSTNKQLYLMDAKGRLICQDCPADAERMIGSIEDRRSKPKPVRKITNDQLTYENFTTLTINGPIKATVEQGETYGIRLSGEEASLEQVRSTQNEEGLNISLDDAFADSPVRIYITMPNLTAAQLTNTDDVLIKDFELDALQLNASGDFELKTDLRVRDLQIEGQAGVAIEIVGETAQLTATLSNESRLDTDRGNLREATLTASGRSRIKIDEATTILTQNISEGSSLKIKE